MEKSLYMEEALKDADIIAADPMYRPICPKKCEFYELPHLAFSGRIYKKKQEKTRKSTKGNSKICRNVEKKSTKFPVST